MLAFTHSVEPAAFVPTHDQPAAEGEQEDTQQTLTASPPLYLVSASTMSSTMARQSVGRWRTRSPTFTKHLHNVRTGHKGRATVRVSPVNLLVVGAGVFNPYDKRQSFFSVPRSPAHQITDLH